MNPFSSSWVPRSTSSPIKWIIWMTCVTSIFSAAVQEILEQFGVFPGPQNFLSLSWWGLRQWFVWQPLSYLFVQDAVGGLSFSFFLILFFSMYLLWVIGSTVLQAIGKAAFLRLYLLGGMAAGFFTLLSMKVTGQYEMLAGAAPSLLILLTVWCLAFPETEVFLFFLIPFQAKWIVAAIVGVLLLISLSHWDLSSFILYLSAVAIGYGYATIGWGWHSPFEITRNLDSRLSKAGYYLRQRMPRWMPKRGQGSPEGKIIDITTGQSSKDDDAFVDAMLAKISRYGEDSLSWSEKRRLQKISERKMNNKQ